MDVKHHARKKFVCLFPPLPPAAAAAPPPPPSPSSSLCLCVYVSCVRFSVVWCGICGRFRLNIFVGLLIGFI